MAEEKKEEKEHYINGGSVIGRRKYCPGSLGMEVKISEEMGEPELKEHTIKGTKVHKAIELLIPTAIERWNWDADKRYLDLPPIVTKPIRAYLKQEWDSEYEYTEVLEAAQLACDDILRILGDKAPNVAYSTERKFILSEELELGGTADFVWGYKDKAGKKFGGIWDYKNGTTHVDATETMQLQLYAVAMNEELGKKTSFESIETHIFIPNTLVRGKETSSRTFTNEELLEAKEEFIEIAKKALGHYGEESLTLSAGSHCKFCKAKGVCKEFHDNIHKKALKDFELAEIKQSKKKLTKKSAGELINQVKATPRVNPEALVKTLTDEQLLGWLANSDYILECDKAVKAYCKGRFAAGTPIPGTKLVSTKPRRMWRKDVGIKEAGNILKEKGVAKPWRTELVTLTDAEEALTQTFAKQLDVGKKEAKALAQEALKDLIDFTKSSTNLVLDVPENASKEEVKGIVNRQEVIDAKFTKWEE